MPNRSRVLLAFAAVYLIWGSTYLGIRFAIETLPPLLMAGARFLLAGGILYAFARSRGAAAPTRAHWLSALIIGFLLLLMGNGFVVLAERTVPSSLAALMIASTPLWMALFEGLSGGGRPTPIRVVALVLGFAAIGLLIGPGSLHGGDALGIVLVLMASPAWVLGSLYARRAPRPASSLMATSLQMLGGGAILLVAGLVLGETEALRTPSAVSVAAFLYLVVFGSLIAFTAYAWLIQVVSPTLVATYAYVNPVVAVFLGWALAGEAITGRTLLAAAAIVVSVVLVTRSKPRGAS